MSETPTDGNDRETLEYLCWHFASTAENFWPIEETVEACIESVDDPDDASVAWEKGQHTRAVMEAASLFKQLHARGYDPVLMAEADRRRTVEEQGVELPELDWDWLQFTTLPSEYTEQYIMPQNRGGDE